MKRIRVPLRGVKMNVKLRCEISETSLFVYSLREDKSLSDRTVFKSQESQRGGRGGSQRQETNPAITDLAGIW